MRLLNSICTGYLLAAAPYHAWQGNWGWAAACTVALAAGIANIHRYNKEEA